MVSCSNVAFLAGTHSDEVPFSVVLLPRPFKWWFEGQTSPTESAKWSFDTFKKHRNGIDEGTSK